MNLETTLPALLLAALTVGVLHALAPDHWLPFAALARARRWSARRTAGVTVAGGLAHLGITALLALGGLWLSAETVTAAGSQMAAVAGVLLLCGGLTYGAWSLHRAVSRKVATGGLLLFFALDPCVALIPLLFAAAPLGAGAAVAVGATYGAATLSTMLLMVLPIRHGLARWSTPFVERWGHALAGASVAAVGVAVMVLGV